MLEQRCIAIQCAWRGVEGPGGGREGAAGHGDLHAGGPLHRPPGVLQVFRHQRVPLEDLGALFAGLLRKELPAFPFFSRICKSHVALLLRPHGAVQERVPGFRKRDVLVASLARLAGAGGAVDDDAGRVFLVYSNDV